VGDNAEPKAVAEKTKSYIVYLGGHNDRVGEQKLIEHSHYELLASVVRSKQAAIDSIFYSYSRNINGFAAILSEEQALAVSKLPDVLSVYPNRRIKLQTTRSWEFLGLEQANEQVPPESLWRKAAYGKDVIIATLDTGAWPESKSFSDEGMGPVPSRWKGRCENSTNFSCNRKLIGARVFHKGFEAESGQLDLSKVSTKRTPRDTSGHGSHTLSTAGGNFVKKASLFGYGEGTAKGGAPGARLASYKVCWSDGLGDDSCAEADILAAFDQGIYDGVDLFSVSIGGSPYGQLLLQDSITIGSLHAVEKGRVVVCAGGNDGPMPGSVSNVAPWIITVGASTIDRTFSSIAFLGNKKICKGESLAQLSLKKRRMYPLISSVNARLPGVDYYDGLSCSAKSLNPRKVKGKIVTCLGGINPDVVMGQEVLRAGGVGMLDLNSPGEENFLLPQAHVLPATELTADDAIAVTSYINSTKYPVAYISPVETKLNTRPAPRVVAFSSRGPNIVIPDILKPDILAPGTNILAAWSGAASPSTFDFDRRRVPFNIISGTSMATPHVAGIAALIKAIHPHWSPAAIRSAIMTTATTMDNTKRIIKDFSFQTASPFDFGAGHINPNQAADPGLIYDISANDYLTFLCSFGTNSSQIRNETGRPYRCPPNNQTIYNLNYPSITVSSLDGPVFVRRTVTYVSNGSATFEGKVRSPHGAVMALKPSKLEFTKTGETQTYHVVMKPRKGFNSTEFGYLTWESAHHVVRSPIVICGKGTNCIA